MGEPDLKVAWVCLHLCSSQRIHQSASLHPDGQEGVLAVVSASLRARVLRGGMGVPGGSLSGSGFWFGNLAHL